MKILVLGSGGREHAIIWALNRTSQAPLDLYCVPGNSGIAKTARTSPVNISELRSTADFAESQGIDLTFVGPEAPLAAGIVDEFERRGLRIVGPSKAASQFEASKVAAKRFMARHTIPTAPFEVASSASEAFQILRSGVFGGPDAPVVLKADGLAAGKGVIVARSRLEAEDGIRSLVSGALIDKAAASQIVIETALTGREVSLLLFSDGRDYALMPAARDHKRIGEGDTGPNTGGMGAITTPSLLDAQTLNAIVREIVEPTLAGASGEGVPIRGILFIGLMLTAAGPQVLEYNVRFGDPETQAILVRLASDLVEIFSAVAEGTLAQTVVRWTEESSACVVLASRGYPGKYESGKVISGLSRTGEREGVQIFHAGTTRSENGEWLTAGGRVLGITATGATLDAALASCYGAAAEVSWEGKHYRGDIGRPATAS